MDIARSIWAGLDWSVITDALLRIFPALLCITLHELCHGYIAFRLGDTTARDAGRLTLNPIRHIDPMGLLMMVVFRFGWAKPVPVNMANFRDPKRGMALTAAAGPACNLVLCVLFLFLYGLLVIPCSGGAAGEIVLQLCLSTAYLSLALAIFNVLPIPPLDGSKVLFSLLSNETYFKLMRYERYGSLVLFALLATGRLRSPLASATQWLFERLFVTAEWGFNLVKGLI